MLDVKEYTESRGNVVLKTTRDLKIFPREYPFRTIAKEYEFYETWNLSVRGYEGMDYRLDHKGRIKCPSCDKLVTHEPISCKACLENTTHRRGRPNAGCKMARCQCSVNAPETVNVEEVTQIETIPAPVVPPSPRWRMSFKASS